MSINWYPGHMYKAQKQIAAKLKQIDLVIEVLDARIPFSSSNPSLRQLIGNKPRLVILNKQDLANPQINKQWQIYFNQLPNTQAILLNCTKDKPKQQIIRYCRQLVPDRGGLLKRIRLMVVGIPNTGKSSLINRLHERTIAKVGNEPAVTKNQQRIALAEDILLFDTPGVMWPKVDNDASGYRLAVTGAIKNTAIDFVEIALYFADFLLQQYPRIIQTRYHCQELPENDEALLAWIATRSGGKKSGGSIDWEKAAQVLINDYRQGHLGALSLEQPEIINP